jgi:TPR repeat protein
MNMKSFCLIAVAISIVLTVSSAFGAVISPPVITVADLFSEVIISETYREWRVVGTSQLNTWPQTKLRQNKLAELSENNNYFLTHSLTKKPVIITENTESFFQGLPIDIARNGSWMGLKYVFFPSSVLSPQESNDPGEPISFYLVKEVPNPLEGDEFEAPLDEKKVNKRISQLNDSYNCYHSSFAHQIGDETCLNTSMCLASANLGNPQAQFEMACHYNRNGDPKKRRDYSKRAADQGHAQSQADYAWMLQHGVGGDVDLISAREYYKKAVDQGYAEAQNNYAWMLQNGVGGNADLELAGVYYKLAADAGLPKYQGNYARFLFDLGGELHLASARKYYKLAADQGHARAQFNYADMLQNGLGGDVDLISAREYYKRAADQGHAEAQNRYAWMLQSGQGGDVDCVLARVYYKQSADQGCAWGQFNYGFVLLHGLGGGVDYRVARESLWRAAEQGHAYAQHWFGSMLEKGFGGPANLILAREYYRLAADQGHLPARKDYERILGGDGGDKKVEAEQKDTEEALKRKREEDENQLDGRNVDETVLKKVKK